jgi:hypothetical protein
METEPKMTTDALTLFVQICGSTALGMHIAAHKTIDALGWEIGRQLNRLLTDKRSS